MLRKLRICIAALFLVGITLLFVGYGRQWWGWMAKLQFLPSCLALNLPVIIGIALLTFVFGRIYCSTICPMGVFQDVIYGLRRRLFPKSGKKRGVFIPEHRLVRYGVFAAAIVSAVAFSQLLLSQLAPYSAYGRIVRSIAGLAEGQSPAPALLVTAGVTLAVIVVYAAIWGREYCNTVCPVGTGLSLLSRFSLFRITIDGERCVSCRRCEKSCKAHCIDIDHKKIDYSRCVDCFDCIGECRRDGIRYSFTAPGRGNTKAGGKTEAKAEVQACGKAGAEVQAKAGCGIDEGRRAFLSTAALIGGGIALGAQNMKLDGGLAEVLDKTSPARSERLVPFGARGVRDFYDRCTACQLCVSNCPNGVLRPSTDIEHFLQPQMGYENGWCRPECTACSQVCPAGAILPISAEEKLSHKIGTAKVNLQLCLAAKGEAGCGNCARHCPVGAVRMVKSEGYSHSIPTVAEEQCIGCGACENLCPSRPLSAITVDGISVHIKKI